MKTRLTRKAKQMASSLLTTLVICTILSIFVMYYLSLIDQQSYLSSRSQVWNMAIAISEAGIEDGLQEINSNNSYPSLAGSDGWSGSNNVFTRTNTLPDGNSYVVTVITTNFYNPAVVCRASVYNIPRYGRNASSSFFAAVALPPAGTPMVTRAVSVTCSKKNIFSAALVSKTGIDLSGNGVYTDSYDSAWPGIKCDLNGKYNVSVYSGDHGDIGTNGGITNSGIVSVGNANIYGMIHTGPNCPVSIGSSGGVGPHCCQASTVAQATSLGYIKDDANFTFPDTAYPSTAGYWTPPAGYLAWATNWIVTFSTNTTYYPSPPPASGVTVNCGSQITSPLPPLVPCCSIVTNNNNGSRQYIYVPITSYTWTFSLTNSVGFTNYYDNIVYGNGCSTLSGSGTALDPYRMCLIGGGGTNRFVSSGLNNQTIFIGTNIYLALPNGLSGNENLNFAQNTSVIVYAGNNSVTSCSISGNKYSNPNGSAGSFIVLCPPSVTSFNFSGNGQFTGCFAAPNANMQLSGGGSANEDFCGSIMMNSIKMNGHFSFHWDEDLVNSKKLGRFLVKTWNEVR
jgi:hypothetical protein